MDFLIEMTGITKVFPGIVANDDVSLHLKKGEVHALLGENGAGKSTLMGILFGLYQAEKGTIKKNSKLVHINGPKDAKKLGIGMVHQHFKLVHNFTVLENIILGAETVKYGVLKQDSSRKKIIELSKKYKLEINPDSLVSDITTGMQQKVEILKMLYRDNEILIFDEPTSVLNPRETEELKRLMKNLAAEGKSILFITHKLDEIKAAADRCTVLRKGKCVGTVDIASTSKEELSEMMVGRKINFSIDKQERQPGETILRVENLTINSKTACGKTLVNDISFEVHSGEIVCIAGIDGNGQQELVHALVGLMNADSGRIFLEGQEITHNGIRSRGFSFIPLERQKCGLVLDYNLAFNFVLQKFHSPQFQNAGLLKFKEIYKYADNLIEKFDIRCGHGSRTIVRSMSGGNQQKAIVAREISRDCRLLVAVQPTSGLDVGACEYIHKQLIAERDKGKGVLLVSFELDEVMEISDRILVIFQGKIVIDVKPKEVNFRELGLFMAGSGKQEAA
ncbi:MAG: ABC transporter ATP-binding protein [Treponema sp.]|jgi:simple sugar transport system ATP-binding protein|nr:ABC transporter ATP-binding protein [Treponema sp.]